MGKATVKNGSGVRAEARGWAQGTADAKPKGTADAKPKGKAGASKKTQAAPEAWTPKAILAGVERYLASISRMVPITEEIETEERDDYGHKVKRRVPVRNQLGEEMSRLEFVLQPTVTDLCLHLGISRSTWYAWMGDAEEEGAAPELVRAGSLMRSFLDRENLRIGGLRGVENALNWDHGVSTQAQSQTAAVSEGVEAFLAKQGGGPTF